MPDPLRHDGLHLAQLLERVHAQDLARIAAEVRRDAAPETQQDLERVGEIVLRLGVVGTHLRERLEQIPVREREQARVDLAYLTLVSTRVLVLDDAEHAALRI